MWMFSLTGIRERQVETRCHLLTLKFVMVVKVGMTPPKAACVSKYTKMFLFYLLVLLLGICPKGIPQNMEKLKAERCST